MKEQYEKDEKVPERKHGICKSCKSIVSIGVNDVYEKTYPDGKIDGIFVGYRQITLHFICPNCKRKSRLLPM